MKKQKPSDLELQILSLLWDKGPLSARDILESMPDGKKRAYTTILSTMQVMEKKGIVSHSTQGVTHLFKPEITKKQVLKPFIKRVVSEFFSGNPSAVMETLLDDATVDQQELQKMKQLLDKKSEKNR